MWRKILLGQGGVLLGLVLAAAVVWLVKTGLEAQRRLMHLEKVCEPGANPSGPGPGYQYGVWTPLVPGLGRKDPRADKARVCAAHGFPQP